MTATGLITDQSWQSPRRILFLTALAVASSYLTYAPLVARSVLLIYTGWLFVLALEDRPIRFIEMVMLGLVLIDKRPAAIHTDPATAGFFGFGTEFTVGLSPLQLTVLATATLLGVRLLKGERLKPAVVGSGAVYSLAIIGLIGGLTNLTTHPRYFFADLLPPVAFLGMLGAFTTLRLRRRDILGLLGWMWGLYVAKASSYLILLALGRFQFTTAQKIRVFGNSTFAPVVLLGIVLLLLYAARRERNTRPFVWMEVGALLLAFAGQFVLYFQRGQLLFTVAGLVYLVVIAGSRLTHTFGRLVPLAAGVVAVIGLGVGIVTNNLQIEPRVVTESISREVSNLDLMGERSMRRTEMENIMMRNLHTYGGFGAVTGQGFGGVFTDRYDKFPKRLTASSYPQPQIDRNEFHGAHSFFNVLLLSTGLAGLLLYLWFCARVALEGWKVVRLGSGVTLAMFLPGLIYLPTLLSSGITNLSLAPQLAVIVGLLYSQRRLNMPGRGSSDESEAHSGL